MDSLISTRHKKNGGSTTDPVTGEDLTGRDVWAVATHVQEIYPNPPTPDQVSAFLRANLHHLFEAHTFIGTWFDREGIAHGQHEINVTEVFGSKDQALQVAEQRGEASIFNLSTFEEVYVNVKETV